MRTEKNHRDRVSIYIFKIVLDGMMIYTIHILIKAHLFIIMIVVVSYVIEKLSNYKWKLLYFSFTEFKKSKYMTRSLADGHSFFYFLFCLGTLVIDAYVNNNATTDFAFWKWSIIMIPLTVLVRNLYYKYTAKDFSKKGFHLD